MIDQNWSLVVLTLGDTPTCMRLESMPLKAVLVWESLLLEFASASPALSTPCLCVPRVNYWHSVSGSICGW